MTQKRSVYKSMANRLHRFFPKFGRVIEQIREEKTQDQIRTLEEVAQSISTDTDSCIRKAEKERNVRFISGKLFLRLEDNTDSSNNILLAMHCELYFQNRNGEWVKIELGKSPAQYRLQPEDEQEIRNKGEIVFKVDSPDRLTEE